MNHLVFEGQRNRNASEKREWDEHLVQRFICEGQGREIWAENIRIFHQIKAKGIFFTLCFYLFLQHLGTTEPGIFISVQRLLYFRNFTSNTLSFNLYLFVLSAALSLRGRVKQ